MTEEITRSGIRTQQKHSHFASQEFTVLLSSTRRGARVARHLTVEQLIAWNQPYEKAAQVVAELCANAVTHAHVPGRSFRLTLKLTGPATLRIEVTDTRRETVPHPPTNPARPLADSGRGLLLVEAYADKWGTDFGPTPCKTVWANLTLT